MALQYHLNHYICPPELALMDFLDLAVARGFVGVGLTERALRECEPVRLLHELRSRGLGISSLNSAGYWLHADAQAAQQQADKNQWLLDCSAALGGAPLNVIVGGLGHAGGRLPIAAARERVREQFLRYAESAARLGVPLLFEPIHPMGMWFKGCVHSLSQTEDFIRGLPGVGVTLDCFHSWWDSDLDGFLRSNESALPLVQICDVAATGEDFTPRRVPPGEGVIDLASLLRACAQRPQPPRLELELFAAQLQGRELGEVIASAMAHLAAIDPSRA